MKYKYFKEAEELDPNRAKEKKLDENVSRLAHLNKNIDHGTIAEPTRIEGILPPLRKGLKNGN